MIMLRKMGYYYMDKRKIELCKYRFEQAKETVQVAKECFDNNHFKDAINRSYYAAFYCVRSVLALEGIDFKRHKDVISYFNKNYVANGQLDRKYGRGLGRLQQKREKSDYDDFYIVSVEETEEQIRFVNELINEVYTRFLKDILDSRREI